MASINVTMKRKSKCVNGEDIDDEEENEETKRQKTSPEGINTIDEDEEEEKIDNMETDAEVNSVTDLVDTVIFEIKEEFKTEFGLVTNLYQRKDGCMLACDNSEAYLLKSYRLENEQLRTIQEIKDIKVFDIEEIGYSEIIMSFVGESVIKRLICEGAFEEVIDVSPFLIRAVHFTSSRNLLISVREKGDVLPLRTISQRKLLVMDSDVNHIHEYEHDENGERLFTVIGRVATKHDAIYVTDYTSYDMDGSVISLQFPNKVDWRYTGSSQPSSKFRPCDILVTENHRIVISDRDNNLIHILKPDSSVLSVIDTMVVGIRWPYSLAIDHSGSIWIGCSQTKDLIRKKIFEAKLYIVKCSCFCRKQ
ncbi:uncharacterized protein LOC134687859 [Mytilus trossulus]|uniref:uncharacterized protein LOC134687859 n=1 Tax=Mytilus trossulus TaxID=6551 RepID=UPI003007CC04